MKKKLIQLAKEEDYEYAFIVLKIPAYLINVPGIDNYMKSNEYIKPIYVYRINVKDGTETLVRTTKMCLLKMKSFKRLLAVSKELEPFNRMISGKSNSFYGYDEYKLAGIPASFILPKAIIFRELDIEKDEEVMKLKEPLVPNPLK